MPDFVSTAVQEIDEQLRALKDEAARLEAARAALTGGRPGRPRTVSSGSGRKRARSTARRNTGAAVSRARRGGNTRANQALELVRKQPGITIPEIAQAMKIQPNYLYRVLPGLASDGEIKRDGQGWHPATSRSSGSGSRARRSPRAAKSQPTPTRTRSARRRTRSTSSTNGRTTRGATRASILAVLAGGGALTASQVATKAGLARPTVSTTLSKLAKSGEVQKADRGYRLASAS